MISASMRLVTPTITVRFSRCPDGSNSVTVAGHDAISKSHVYPTCLIFVPSSNGVSHNEAEFTAEQDLRNGLRVLTALLYRICTQPPVRR